MVVAIVSMAVTVIVIVVVLVPAVIAFVIVVPFMTVFNAAMFTFPVAVVEAFSVVARADPASTFIGWLAPIAFMPAIVTSGGIPVAADPDESGSGLHGDDGDNARLGRSANADANRDLRVSGNSGQKHGRQ
jgi:hypothetical protein